MKIIKTTATHYKGGKKFCDLPRERAERRQKKDEDAVANGFPTKGSEDFNPRPPGHILLVIY